MKIGKENAEWCIVGQVHMSTDEQNKALSITEVSLLVLCSELASPFLSFVHVIFVARSSFPYRNSSHLVSTFKHFSVNLPMTPDLCKTAHRLPHSELPSYAAVGEKLLILPTYIKSPTMKHMSYTEAHVHVGGGATGPPPLCIVRHQSELVSRILEERCYQWGFSASHTLRPLISHKR